MEKQIDVYRDWLGIKETERPLNYYHLLRLKRFEDDPARVRDHYRKMNAHVRKYATGEFGPQSQALLNELAKAMLCLTDAQRKREYDISLGRKDAGEMRRRTFEEVLLLNQLVSREQLDKARSFADAVGLDVRDAVLQQKMASAEAVMLAYAESQGLPYVDLGDLGVDETLARQIPPPLARQHSCVPIMADRGELLMASPNPLIPDVEEELRLRFGMPVRSVLCTASALNEAIGKYYPRDAVAMTPAAPQAAAPSSSPAAAPQEVRPELPPEERLRRNLMTAIVGFNVGVIGVIVAQMFRRGGAAFLSMGDFGTAFLAGLVLGGLCFLVMSTKKT